MDVSVVIVNWNTKDFLRDCLRSLYDNTGSIEFEVIIIDNASSDGSTTMVREQFPQAIVIDNTKNLGYATANNKGIAVARGRYVLILNSDMIFIDNSIFKLCSFADTQPDTAVLGCKILNRDRSLQESTFMFPSILNLFLLVTYLSKVFPKNKFFGRERMGWWDWNDQMEVDVITGCLMFVRKEAIEEVGGMDNQFFMYYEETDWCYRFKKAGWKIMYAPVSEVIHLGGESTKKNPDEMFLQLYSSMLLYFRKQKGRLSYLVACKLLILYFVLRIPYWLAHSLVSHKTMKADLNTARVYAKGIIKTFRGWAGLRIKTN